MANEFQSIEIVKVESWGELLKAMRSFGRSWAFRGEKDASRQMKTTLERSGTVDPFGDENRLFLRFLRRAGVHLPSHMVPPDNDRLGWLAMMQHYGAPTRLLDFTLSPYVALFFAFERYDDKHPDRSLWAVNTFECQRRAVEILKHHLDPTTNLLWRLEADQGALVNELIRDVGDILQCTFPVEPWRFDARQMAQQTVLFYPTSVNVSFDANLKSVLAQVGQWPLLRKYEIPDALRPHILRDLTSMNVTAASLFPGLDGYARSMYSHLTIGPPETTGLMHALEGDT